MQKVLVLCIAVATALSASCRTRWYHPARGETEFHQDTVRCEVTANQMADSYVAWGDALLWASLDHDSKVRRYYGHCMRRLGYTTEDPGKEAEHDPIDWDNVPVRLPDWYFVEGPPDAQPPPQPDAPSRSGGELPDFVNDFLEFCQKTGSSREECTEYLVDWVVEEAKKEAVDDPPEDPGKEAVDDPLEEDDFGDW